VLGATDSDFPQPQKVPLRLDRDPVHEAGHAPKTVRPPISSSGLAFRYIGVFRCCLL
jgi:hypothetical protein